MLFMLVVYRLPGLMADIALCIYMLVVFYALALVPGVQLTLPGIAGIVLGIGMAVDGNVIIFERFREELKGGRSIKMAVQRGYKNALSSIIDSNVTTIIAAIVLINFGTGSIKGFAITLLIGVVTSMISSLLVTRFLLKKVTDLDVKNPALYSR
jgi:protein-export membrane protein SecD